MIAVWFAAIIAIGPSLGTVLRWYDQAKARRLAEMERLTAPLPAPRLNLTDQYVLTPIGGRGWPARQTPTDLAAAYEDSSGNCESSKSAPWRDGQPESRRRYAPSAAGTPAPAPDRAPLDGLIVPVREQATIGDRYACNQPCTARHCIHHAGIVGSIAQRFRWNTDTAEFSLLGLTVPDFVPLRSFVYEEAT